MIREIRNREERQRRETETVLPHLSPSLSQTSVANLCLASDHLLPRPALIAIVDDDLLVRRSLTRLIKSVGFKVEAFAAAEDFLLHGSLHDTRCLILDVGLPGMSGLNLQRRLAAYHHIPIIFVSAHDEHKTREQALQAGAVAFLNKPFSEEALLSSVRSVLKSPH